ncbi:hypothetical protein [uncultured Phascolarctobacterium sp.]|uniref:hypothetical protein n=1 Tax=uncultured Phascolarctobacterium sp. TaxID=512296 RepID=UPI0026162252|nr:hypothetical protein [uncultured Phascolarctobacterium sp.]
MKIMLITLNQLSDFCGGAEKVFSNMANVFAEKNYSVCALYFDKSSGGVNLFFQ